MMKAARTMPAQAHNPSQCRSVRPQQRPHAHREWRLHIMPPCPAISWLLCGILQFWEPAVGCMLILPPVALGQEDWQCKAGLPNLT